MFVSVLDFFFFSSRRRHTRSLCDWSSDVCSSDLFESNDPLAEFECALDTPAGEQPDWGSCPNPVDYNGLTVGAHELLVRAKDDLGKVDLTPARYQWTIKPLPETTIDPSSGPEDLLDSELGVQTDRTEATFEFTSDQPGATFECRLDTADATGSYEPCTSPMEYTGLAFEEHDFFVRAKDADGNVDPTPAEFSWEIADITPPETTIDSGPKDPTSDTSATFEFSSDESDATFQCALDGGNFATCDSGRTYTGLTVGEHTLRVQAIDPTENVDPTPAEYTWTVEPPNTPAGSNVAVEIEAPNGTPATVLSGSVTSRGETTMTGASKPPTMPNGYLQVGARFYDIDTTATFTGSTEVCLGYDPATFDSDGPRLLHNENGEWKDVTTGSPSSGLVCGTVQSLSPFAIAAPADTSAPETRITEQPAKTSNSAAATFRFDATDNKTPAADLKFECRLDSTEPADFGSCTSPQGYSGLNEGSHTFDVRAVDQAGNAGNAVGYTWTIDTTAPQTTLDSKPDALTSSTNARFEFSSAAGATFECKLDGATFAACDSPEEYTALGSGEHTLSVRATDEAGNVETPVSHTWKVDTTAPQATIDSLPPASTTETVATFTFSADELGSKFECSLDDALFTACDSPQEFSELALGQHIFKVRATDAAGNTGSPAEYVWTIEEPADITAPDTQITGQPAKDGNSTAATFSFTGNDNKTPAADLRFECQLDNQASGFVPCTNPQNYSGLGQGLHT